MRLIDADKLVKVIKWWQEPLTANEYQKTIRELLDSVLVHIDAQPTAYDIDKVVEQLEQEQKNPNSYVYAWGACEKAIEIVKGGAK